MNAERSPIRKKQLVKLKLMINARVIGNTPVEPLITL